MVAEGLSFFTMHLVMISTRAYKSMRLALCVKQNTKDATYLGPYYLGPYSTYKCPYSNVLRTISYFDLVYIDDLQSFYVFLIVA